MSHIEDLLQAYAAFVAQPWPESLAGAERVWFAVYEPVQERRLLFRIAEFETATTKMGHGWKRLHIADLFAVWMACHRYRDAYFEDPEAMELALHDLSAYVAAQVRATLTAPDVDGNTVVAMSGVGSLFGLVRASEVIERVTSNIRGRLLVFFPGRYENSRYRLLDARDGWNYLAIPILATKGD